MEDLITRVYAATRAEGVRILSGQRSPSMADQLADLTGGGADLHRRIDSYGDGIVTELEERVAGLLGKPAAAFFPTGTMAQQVALRCWALRAGSPVVATHPLHHLETWERRAYSVVSGLRPVFPGRDARQPTAQEIREHDEPFGTLVVELPMAGAGYLLPTFDELFAMVGAARERGAYVHFDGARLWESIPYLGRDLAEVCALADSVYVSFYKGLNAMSGAALAGPADVMAEAKAWRHRYGGQVLTQWPAVVSALAGLDRELPRLPEYVAHARTVAAALAALPGARVFPDPPHTHQFEFWLPYPAEVLNECAVEMIEQDRTRFVLGWSDQPPGDRARADVSIRAHALAWTAEDVSEVGTAYLARVAAAMEER